MPEFSPLIPRPIKEPSRPIEFPMLFDQIKLEDAKFNLWLNQILCHHFYQCPKNLKFKTTTHNVSNVSTKNLKF